MKNVEYTLNSPINCSISINAAPNIRIRTSTDAAPATAITSAIPLLPPQPTKVRSISILKKWDELELIYGEALRQCVCGVIEVSAKPDEADRSLRHLLGFLATQAGLSDSAFAAPIIAALIGKRDPNFADPQYVQAIASALRKLHSHLLGHYSGTTATGYSAAAARLLETLGNRGDSRFAPFERRLVTFPEHTSETLSLAELEWPETVGLSGAEAERRALELMRNDAVTRFEVFERRFETGQRIVGEQSPPPDCPPDAWLALKTLIGTEQQHWLRTGRSQFDPIHSCSDEVTNLMDRICSLETWLSAGGPCFIDGSSATEERIDPFSLRRMTLECLGPTIGATLAVMIVLCVDSGWNRQSIIELPRNPYLFSTKSEVALASSAFISSFKARAGHDVVAHLERGETLRGLGESVAKAAWAAAVTDFDPSGRELGYLMAPAGKQRGKVTQPPG